MDTATGDQNHHRRDWSSLDYDLTDHIFRNYLPFSDLLRCRNVCTSWRFVSHTIVKSSPVNSPILVVPKSYLPRQIISSYEDRCYFFLQHDSYQVICFFNPVANKLYPLDDKSKQLLTWRSFIGLSKGWALFQGLDDLVLFNAPTGVCIRMPCPGTALIGTKKAVLWGGDPILDTKRKNNSHGIVAMTYHWPPVISFAMWGETRFEHTLQDSYNPCDVLYFHGLLYAVFGNGFTEAWSFNETEFPFIHSKVEHYGTSFSPGNQLHLVDSSGELWLVSTLHFDTGICQIRVYKMDFKRRMWIDMDSLGDKVVVLCKNQSIAFSPLGPSKYKRNCVYFEDCEEPMSIHRCMYVYDIEDGSITKTLL